MSDVLQKQFEKFHNSIKLSRFKENQILREKRDIIVEKLKMGLKTVFDEQDVDPPEWDYFNQGSYDIGTGVKPLDGDFDIDVGIRFYFDHKDYEAVDVKKWVRDALKGHTKEVRIKEPCVTVQYSVNDEPTYHVDLAIYAYEENTLFPDSYLLARGKENSLNENRFWEEAAPIELSDKLKNRFSDEEDKQYRRVIRYLKRWKDRRFSSDGNSAPSGIGITLAAYNWFSPDISYFSGKSDDLSALKRFVNSMLNHFMTEYDPESGVYYHRLKVELPVKPFSDIFSKMTRNQMSNLKSKLEVLRDVLNEASKETDPYEASKILSKEFADFPIPERKNTAQIKKAAISTNTAQA